VHSRKMKLLTSSASIFYSNGRRLSFTFFQGEYEAGGNSRCQARYGVAAFICVVELSNGVYYFPPHKWWKIILPWSLSSCQRRGSQRLLQAAAGSSPQVCGTNVGRSVPQCVKSHAAVVRNLCTRAGIGLLERTAQRLPAYVHRTHYRVAGTRRVRFLDCANAQSPGRNPSTPCPVPGCRPELGVHRQNLSHFEDHTLEQRMAIPQEYFAQTPGFKRCAEQGCAANFCAA